VLQRGGGLAADREVPAEQGREQQPLPAAVEHVVGEPVHAAVDVEPRRDRTDRAGRERVVVGDQAERDHGGDQGGVDRIGAEPLGQVAVHHALAADPGPDLGHGSGGGVGAVGVEDVRTEHRPQAAVDGGEGRDVPVLGMLLPPVVTGQ